MANKPSEGYYQNILQKHKRASRKMRDIKASLCLDRNRVANNPLSPEPSPLRDVTCVARSQRIEIWQA
jgi:hypothetical protein